MTSLVVLPCWLRVRPYKGMGVNVLYPDVELDRIMLANEIARNKNGQRRTWPVSTGEPLSVDPESRAAS